MKLQLIVAIIFIAFSSFVFADSHLGDDTILPIRPVGYGNKSDSGSFALSASIADYSPKWSWLDLENTSDDANKNWITISGCGFKQFAEAVCVFDFKFTSTYSYIHDDNTIYCELPTKSVNDFDTLPQVSRLDVVFDGELSTFDSSNSNNGNRVLYVGPFRWGPQIECDDPISPLRGDTSGETITVHGQGFADAALSELKVWVDDQECTGSSVQSDTAITCSAPPAVVGGFREINKYSVVSVTWGADTYWSRTSNGTAPECYLHANRMYKYGPEVEDIFPACTSVYGEGAVGNRELTIRGSGFLDSAFNVDPASPDGSNYNNQYLIEVTVENDELPENPFVLQARGQATENGIRFAPPNFFEYTDESETDWQNFFGATATVVVYYRQLNRWYSIDTNESPLSFTYGPIIESFTFDDDSKITALHAGGEDSVCFHGCGFSNYTNDHIKVEFASGNSNFCTADGIQGSGDSQFCCETVAHECGPTDIDVIFYFPENDDLTTDVTISDVLGDDDVYVGPIVDAVSPSRYRVTPIEDMEVSGTSLMFTADCSDTTSGCWSEFPLVDKMEAIADKSYHCSDPNQPTTCSIESGSIGDSEMNYNLPLAEFDASFTPEFTFDRPDSGLGTSCSSHANKISFGPTCEDVIRSTAIFGDESVTVQGTFFGNYETHVRLCRISATNCDELDEYENVTSTVRTAESISLLTENWKTDAEEEFNRGRRYWGQQFDVLIWFNSAADGLVAATSGYDYTFDECEDCDGCTGSCDTFARKSCGKVRFGPTITSIEPCKGPISGSTGVELFATDAADQWAQPRDDDALSSHNLVIFGTLFGSVGTQSESSVSTTTVWGATANTDDGVSVIFDTCNITSAVTEDGSDDEITVAWGPDLYFQSKGDDAWALSFGASTNFWRDTETTSETYGFWWGLPAYADAGYPADGDDILTINGHGFDEFSHFAASVDGVLVSATLVSETIRVEVPVRPFGTIAKVCVHFGSLKCNNHGSVFTGDLESNYKYKICSEEYLVYQPYVGGLSATNFRTSGYAAVDGDGDLSNNINNIATTVLELRADSYFEKDGFEIFVGQYKADVTDHTPTAVTFRVPTFSAEFNSYASVRVEWKTPVRLTNDEDEWHGCDEDNNRHWGAVASEMIHFGPLCSGAHTSEANWLLGTEQKGDGIHLLSDSYPTVGRHLAKNIVVTLATQFLMDCTFDYENDQECPDDTNLNDCSHPQRSTQLQNIQTDDDSGIFKRCLHRNVEVRISDFGSENPFGGDSVDYSVAGNDDIFVVANKTDTQIKAFVKARDDDIDCTFITFGLYFPDALVTSDDQRWIECTDAQGDIWKHYYGPTVQIFEENDDNNAVWWRSNDDFAELSKVYRGGASDADLPFFYGWGYESMTSSVRKEAEGGAENSVNVDIKTGGDDDFFEYDLNGDERTGNYLVPYLSNNHPDVSVENLHSTSIDWFAPAGDDDDFGEIVSVKLFWALQSSTSGRICERTVFHFHYGPILTGSTRDGCIDPVPLREAGGESTTDSRVTIKGRAFTCCGFEDITTGPSDLDGMTGCYFQTNSNNRATRNTYVRANGATEQFDDGLSEIVCSIPESDSPEFRLAGFGLCFNCTNADEYCGPDDGSICDGDADADGFLLTRTDTDTDSEGYMDICYGPKLSDSTDLPRVRMSGLEDPNNLPGCVTDNLVTGPDFYEYYENAKVVTLDYQGVAEGSPNSLLHQNKANITFCAQCSFDPSWSNQVITTSCERYDSNVDCKVPVFLHQCGDGPDEVFVEWLFTADGEARSYIQKDFDYPPTISGTRWLEEGVDRVDEYLYYGPTASVKLNEHGDDHGLMVNRKQFRLPTTAASFDPITVVLENFEDWHCDSLNSDVSPARTKSVMCIVENNDGYLYRSLDDNENANSVNVVSFNTQSFYQIDSSGEIECYFGNGYFGAEGKLRILLDPHVDQWTVLSATDDDWNPVGDGSYWHWHASSSMLSKTWGGPSGLEPITFYGAGFCEYSHVKCIFDQAGERSSYAVQGDIIGDGMVVCQSPPNHAPQEGTLSISFCGSDDGDVLDAAYTNGTLPCDCNFGHCETADEISLGFTFVGADAVHPRHGPVFGNTTVYFSNVGLEDNAYYDRIECVFHIDGREEVVLATSTDMDLNVTVSPPAGTFSCVTPPVENGRQHALVEIRGYYNTFENQVGGYLFDANLGCFWFDYGYPTVRSVTPSTTVFGSSDDVIVVSGDYFNGGTSTGDYLCYWQHGALPSSDLPDELGQDPTFSTGRVYVTEGLLVNVAGNWDGQDFNDFEIHCIAPNFEQIGAYPFDVSFQSSEVTSQLYGSPVWRYDVTPGAATIEFVETDHFDDDDDNSTPIEPDDYYMDELGGIITLHGTGFAGGRLESDDHTYGYVCTFEASLNGTDVVRHTIALSDVSNTEVVCVAPYFELSDNDLDFTEVAVSLSVDTGYSLQASASLEYRSNSDLIECLEDGAAQSLVFASFFLLLSAFILHFLF